jgi:hypothetical protein
VIVGGAGLVSRRVSRTRESPHRRWLWRSECRVGYGACVQGNDVESERYSYDAETLRRAMETFERAYGLSSDEFYALYVEGGELPAELPRFDRHVWASFVEDVRRLEGSAPIEPGRRLEASTPIERARRTFAHA